MDNEKNTSLAFGRVVIGVIGGIICYVGKHMGSNLERQISE